MSKTTLLAPVVTIASGKQVAPALVTTRRQVLRPLVALGGPQTVTLTPTQ